MNTFVLSENEFKKLLFKNWHIHDWDLRIFKTKYKGLTFTMHLSADKDYLWDSLPRGIMRLYDKHKELRNNYILFTVSNKMLLTVKTKNGKILSQLNTGGFGDETVMGLFYHLKPETKPTAFYWHDED